MRHISDLEGANFSYFGCQAGLGSNNRGIPGVFEALAFMHQLRSPAGHVRLVSIAIRGGGTQPDNSVYVSLHSDIFTLATSATVATNVSSHDMAMTHGTADHPMTIFAGQTDPLDPSHFTIPIDFRGQRRVIDGHLRDDDTILLDPHLGYVVTRTSGRDELFAIDSYALTTIAIPAPTFKLIGGNRILNIEDLTYSCCAFSPDGTLLAVGVSPPAIDRSRGDFGPARVRLLDAKTGKEVREFQANAPTRVSTYAIAFSPDGAMLATMDYDYGGLASIRLFTVATGQEIGECAAGDIRRFSLMRFDADKKQFIATNRDTEYVFSLPDLKLLRTQPVPPLKAASISVQPPSIYLGGGKTFPTYRDDFVTPAPGQYYAAFDIYADQVEPPGAASSISPDGRWYAWPYPYQGPVSVVDIQKQAVRIQRLVWGNFAYPSAMFTPDGRFLVSSLDGHGLCLWQMPDCDVLYDIPIQLQTRILFFAISPDDKHVATIDAKDTLNVWDLPAPPTTGG
jgi:WD40 repeat protein